MPKLKDFWSNRPAFSRANLTRTPEKEERLELVTESSPLTEPPSSFVFDTISPESEQAAEAHLKAALYLSAQESHSKSHQSFQSIEPAAGVSSLNASFNGSQRIIKDGKEVVISSDGEDTDSVCSLEDPGNLFAPKYKKKEESEPVTFSTKLFSPKKYTHNIDSLVYDAVDDNEVEARVAQARANYVREPEGDKLGNGTSGDGYTPDESMLISALEEDEDGIGSRRLIGAIRRTNALDNGRAWRFFDPTQSLPAAPEFPRDLCLPGTSLAILRNSDARERQFMSGGVIQMALAKRLVPDEILLWMFRSIPHERREELSNAYYRALKGLDVVHLKLLIRPIEIEDLFLRLGARTQALDPSKEILPVPFQYVTTDSGLRDHVTLLSVLRLLRETAGLFAEATQERVMVLLLRLTLDASLTSDYMVCSELQWTINTVLDPDNFTDINGEDLLHRVCLTCYNTIRDVCLQSQIVHHLLPTSAWFALFRCRLAVAFLLQSPEPLTEPPEKLLDLKRLTILLLQDERFDVKRFQSIVDYDWRELSALTSLLNVAIDTSAFDLNYQATQTEKDYNAAVDRLAAQVKMVFCSIQDSGASHVTRTVAKSELEALHYRIVYSVRTKPPPKTTIFESHAKERDIRGLFGNYAAIAAGKHIPIRAHDSMP